ncbi:hypothetical protein Tco_0863192 [Tanacetum coccineum]
MSDESTNDNTSTIQQDGSSSSGYASDAEKAWDDKAVSDKENAAVGPSLDNNTLTEVHHLNNDTFENVFALKILNHEQLEVENYTKVNREASQAMTSLTKGLEIFKEIFFANQTTNDSKYCNKIKLLNEEISNLKSQACKKEKSFHKENEKYAEYVQPLLNRKNELEKTNQEFLKQINDLNNKLLISKRRQSKELTSSLYDIDEMGKDLLSNHKIIYEEELKCEAEKHLKVKQRKSSLSYHGFLYGETQFEEPPKVPLKRRQVNLKKHLEQAQLQEINQREFITPWDPDAALKRNVQKRLSKEFEPLARNINLQLNSFEKSLVQEIKDDLKYVLSLADEFDEKYLSKPVTPHYWPKVREPAFAKPHHVIASRESRNSSKNMPSFSSNDMVHNHYLEEAKKNHKKEIRIQKLV